MNWNTGFKRLSAVFWGFWALFVGMVLAIDAKQMGFLEFGGALLLLAIGIYLLHRVTCWIIDGFTSSKANKPG